MSVLKNQRGESPMEFVNNARQLQIFTTRMALKFPKRYTFFGGQQIYNIGQSINTYVIRGNSIYPTNAHEAQLRRDCFMKALAEVQVLANQIGLLQEQFSIDLKKIHSWSYLIDKEDRLLRAVLKKDKERYKNL